MYFSVELAFKCGTGPENGIQDCVKINPFWTMWVTLGEGRGGGWEGWCGEESCLVTNHRELYFVIINRRVL